MTSAYIVEGKVWNRRINLKWGGCKLIGNINHKIYQIFLDLGEAEKAIQECNKIAQDSVEIWCHRKNMWFKYMTNVRIKNSNVKSELARAVLFRLCNTTSFDAYFSDFTIRKLTLSETDIYTLRPQESGNMHIKCE